MRLEMDIAMNDTELCDSDAVVSALDALHAALTEDLEALEDRIRLAGQAMTADSIQAQQDIAELHEARTGLHSGLASIAEVLGWLQWKIAEDAEGNVAMAAHPLPTLHGFSIH
jgi:hypothetical protein